MKFTDVSPARASTALGPVPAGSMARTPLDRANTKLSGSMGWRERLHPPAAGWDSASAGSSANRSANRLASTPQTGEDGDR